MDEKSNGIVVNDGEFAIRMLKHAGRKVVEGDAERSVIVSPFYGDFGLSGFMLSLQGTPPQVTFMVHMSHRTLAITTMETHKIYDSAAHEGTWREALRFLKKHGFEIVSPANLDLNPNRQALGPPRRGRRSW